MRFEGAVEDLGVVGARKLGTMNGMVASNVWYLLGHSDILQPILFRPFRPMILGCLVILSFLLTLL